MTVSAIHNSAYASLWYTPVATPPLSSLLNDLTACFSVVRISARWGMEITLSLFIQVMASYILKNGFFEKRAPQALVKVKNPYYEAYWSHPCATQSTHLALPALVGMSHAAEP